VSDIESIRPFPKESELANRIKDLIFEYEGELSTVAVIGILDLVKAEITIEAMEQ